jgi:hypothetical protein
MFIINKKKTVVGPGTSRRRFLIVEDSLAFPNATERVFCGILTDQRQGHAHVSARFPDVSTSSFATGGVMFRIPETSFTAAVLS